MEDLYTELFRNLRSIDDLKDISFDEIKCFIHTNHRYALPLIFWA